MPLITASHDSLPCPHSLSAARALISSSSSSSLAPSYEQTPHPSLPPFPASKLTPLAQAEQERIARSEPLSGGIDTTRYELPDDGDDDEDGNAAAASPSALKKRLQQAYTSSHYLRQRGQRLALLNEFGKNAWLVGNAQLEEVLKGVERDLVDAREAVEAVNRERKGKQERARGEMEGLERGWRQGLRRVVEVEVEIGKLEERRRDVLKAGGR
ncbi:MAG: hypothetical protein Q9207_000442 [Kuettlingeria erythrocarpa]